MYITVEKPKDLFKKCFDFTLADEVKAQGVYPFFHPIDENEGPVVSFGGRKLVMAGSNNYLGLTSNPKVKEASINAIKKIRDQLQRLALHDRNRQPPP